MNVPCLLRNSDSAYEELEVASEDYYPVKVRLEQTNQLQRSGIRSGHRPKASGVGGGTNSLFYVKKRSGSNMQRWDSSSPHALASTTSFRDHRGSVVATNLYLRAYARYMLRPPLSSTPAEDPEFPAMALVDSAARDAEEALPLYLSLLASSGGGGSGSSGAAGSLSHARDLRLIRTYYQERHRFAAVEEGFGEGKVIGNKTSGKDLLNADLLLAYLQEMA